MGRGDSHSEMTGGNRVSPSQDPEDPTSVHDKCVNSGPSSSKADPIILKPAEQFVFDFYSGQNQNTLVEPEQTILARKVRRAMSESRRNSQHEEPTLPPKSARTFHVAPVLRPLRHIVHVVILVAGWMLGTCIFYAIEVPAEREAVAVTFGQLNDAFSTIAEDLLVTGRNENQTVLKDKVKQSYIKLLEIEGKWRWSAIQKTEGPEAHYMWTFGTSFFFTWTLFTTVGYGSIYPGTDLSRGICIVYSCFFYPFSLVVIRDLGQLLLIFFTRIYGRLLIKIREARGYLTSDKETISLPWVINAMIAFAFMFLCAWIFKVYDEAAGPEEGMSYFISFYFTFLSLTAIGLGDIMPTNEPWAPFIGIIIVAGLPIMRVITKMTYTRIERAYFGAFLYVESWLEARQAKHATTDAISEKGEEDCLSSDDEDDDQEKKAREAMMQNFTIRSLTQYIASGEDVYGGEFGRVSMRKSEL